MNQYFDTNYSQCSQDFTFLASSKYLQISLHIFSFFSIPLGIYGGYLILYQTPPKMKNNQNCMMYLHVCTFIMDIVFNVLVSPMLFLPSLAINVVGYLYDIGVGFKPLIYIAQESLFFFGMSILTLFQNRHSCITTIYPKMTNKYTIFIYYAIHYTFGVFCLFVYFFDVVDNEVQKLKILTYIPCPVPEFFSSRTEVLTERNMLVSSLVGFECTNVILNNAFFVLHSAYHLSNAPSSISIRTRKLQLYILIIFFIQVSIPFLVLIIPVTGILSILFVGGYHQVVNLSFAIFFGQFCAMIYMYHTVVRPTGSMEFWLLLIQLIVLLNFALVIYIKRISSLFYHSEYKLNQKYDLYKTHEIANCFVYSSALTVTFDLTIMLLVTLQYLGFFFPPDQNYKNLFIDNFIYNIHLMIFPWVVSFFHKSVRRKFKSRNSVVSFLDFDGRSMIHVPNQSEHFEQLKQAWR
ncbi:unnamed protein product [Caenorhabditis angaria]|uniref:Uncharacterized protein n=1 Tax=Caenorhabditis angaria TaxID=860376 RepID=A0A9P1N5Z5_9PELO|nr:unnamed protein product [Caenorhabditis angaria]